MKWITPSQLKSQGILGMNCRNRDFIGRYNPRERFPLVDNKLKTKLMAKARNLATPNLLFVARAQYEIAHIERKLTDLAGFAIKPAKGSGGKGIWVIVGRDGEQFIKSSGARVTLDDIRHHMSNTLAGLYSLGGATDAVLVEELIDIDPYFSDYSFEGVPDIRIVVFKGYPIMAMLRLATRASDGKANLHQGAVGVGLDIGTGKCLQSIQFNTKITAHPDTQKPLGHIAIKDWSNLLLLASRCFDMTGLGYMGADLVLDAKRGAELLELNARPGLAIQMANGQGLLPRLRHIEQLPENSHVSAIERVEYIMREFTSVIVE